jgi:pilus assembly protein Flp/PilA
MLERIKRFLKDEEGASMAEYALLITLITVALAAIIGTFSTTIIGVFQCVIKKLGGSAG